MKRSLTAALVFMMAVSLFGQKEAPKPNVNKALTLAKQGKFAEAKSIVDGVPTHEKTMADYRAWFYRGIVYVAMDTAAGAPGSSENVKIGEESFRKAGELAGPKGKLSITDAATGESKSLQDLIAEFNYKFLIKGDKLFNEEKFSEAVQQFEKGLILKPDTAIYRYAGYAAHNANDVDKAIDFIGQYIANGGTNSQAIFLRIGSLYEFKKDYEATLKACRERLVVSPNDGNVRQIELNCLLQLGRYKEATDNLLNVVKANPNDVESLYLLGALYEEQKNSEEAKTYFQKCRTIDPKFLKAALSMARYGTIGFQKIKEEMDALDYKKDKLKLEKLDKVYLEKLREAAVLWEECEKLSPNEREVLENLWRIYSPSQLDEKVKYAAVEKKMQLNGFFD